MPAFFPFFIGFRYLFSKRRERFVSFVSLFSIVAMALGVMALITVLSVMNGFDREIKTRILRIMPHAVLEHPGGLREWEALAQPLDKVAGIRAVEPYIQGQGMLSFQGRVQGVSLQGVDPEARPFATAIAPHMLHGELGALTPRGYGIIIGRLLARNLGVGVGDALMLSLPDVLVTPAGVFPRTKQVWVSGIFETGAQVDNGVAILHLQDAARLLRLGDKVSGLRLYLEDPFGLNTVDAISQSLPEGVRARTWREEMKVLFSAIKMEKTVVGLLLSAIIGIAAFNIIASLVLMVSEKRSDIAVLRSLGADASEISTIFRIQGSLTGLMGVGLGVLAGCLLALYIGDVLGFLETRLGFVLFDPELYFITKLPSRLLWQDVMLIAGLGLLLSLLATWYPARRAGMVPPADVLRYR